MTMRNETRLGWGTTARLRLWVLSEILLRAIRRFIHCAPGAMDSDLKNLWHTRLKATSSGQLHGSYTATHSSLLGVIVLQVTINSPLRVGPVPSWLWDFTSLTSHAELPSAAILNSAIKLGSVASLWASAPAASSMIWTWSFRAQNGH